LSNKAKDSLLNARVSGKVLFQFASFKIIYKKADLVIDALWLPTTNT